MLRIIIFILTCLPLNAVLPPLYQDIKEIQAILDKATKDEIFHSGVVIQEITRSPPGYIIITNEFVLPITINYEKPSMPGPASFTVHFGEPLLLSK